MYGIGPSCPDDLDGKSWITAFYTLQACLDDVNNKPPNVDYAEVWVKEGSYTPSEAPDWAGVSPQFFSFILYPDTYVYGGFAGTESSRSERNFLEHPTYLSCQVSSTYCTIIMEAASGCIVDGFIFHESRYSGGVARRRMSDFGLDVGTVLKSTDPARGGGIFSNGTNIIVSNNIFTDLDAFKGYVCKHVCRFPFPFCCIYAFCLFLFCFVLCVCVCVCVCTN